MNVFLLDPPGRLLASFIWVSGPNTIGLYTLLDWDTQEYVYIDTGIECVSPALLRLTASFINTNVMVMRHSYNLQTGPASYTKTK